VDGPQQQQRRRLWCPAPAGVKPVASSMVPPPPLPHPLLLGYYLGLRDEWYEAQQQSPRRLFQKYYEEVIGSRMGIRIYRG